MTAKTFASRLAAAKPTACRTVRDRRTLNARFLSSPTGGYLGESQPIGLPGRLSCTGSTMSPWSISTSLVAPPRRSDLRLLHRINWASGLAWAGVVEVDRLYASLPHRPRRDPTQLSSL